ncbi:MAG: alanine--tRNA ligase [Microgenomates group bacterium]
MTANEIREKYLKFFSSAPRNHSVIPSAPLVPENDPTTLFNSAGMQPLIPYLLGQPHPQGKRLVNSQKSFRSQDIDEIGDNRHMTFFEMLGNWSLGDYFKSEQLHWFFEFVTKELGLDPNRIYVSVFAGGDSVAKDDESTLIWKSLGISDDHIFSYDVEKNWWSRSGTPEKMPAGELGGPDSEMFYDFGAELQLHENSQYKNDTCHPNCDCGRFLEIGNSVFMQYKKMADGTLEELPQKNVDFGGGLERLNAAANDKPDSFLTDSFSSIISEIEKVSSKKYGTNAETTRSMRIIADHMRGAVMMITDGVVPSNKQQGYILRKLIRRSMLHAKRLGIEKSEDFIPTLVAPIAEMFALAYPEVGVQQQTTLTTILDEGKRFGKTIEKGLKELEKMDTVDGKEAFTLYETYGFPWELTEEIVTSRGQTVNRQQFEDAFKQHQLLSRTASAGMFKGGLADHSVETTRLHTTHHLLLRALQEVIDPTIKQRGSNITVERLRMDFNFARKVTPEELKEVENLVNKKISENLSVTRLEMPRDIAENTGAQMEFGHKYPDNVSVYFVGLKKGTTPETVQKGEYYSAEFCGGPHVSFTGELGHFTIDKEESASAGIRRIYGHLNHEDTGSTTTPIPQK